MSELGAADPAASDATVLCKGAAPCMSEDASTMELEEELIKRLDEHLLKLLDETDQPCGRSASAAPAPSPPPLSDGEKRAIDNFESATGKAATLEDVLASREGIAHWSCLNMDVRAGSATHSACMRALKHDPAARAVYENIPDDQKVAFKKHWAVKRAFGFTRARRAYSAKYSITSEAKGTFMTLIAIANKLGGYTIPQCRQGAIEYARMCYKVNPAYFVNENNWTKMRMFLFVERLSTTSSEEAWAHEVESMSEENPWKEMAELNKAKIAYAAVNGKKASLVTEEELAKTSLGVAGWASVTPTMQAVEKATPSAKAKASGNKGSTARGATGVDDEKVLRALMGSCKSCRLTLERMEQQAIDDPNGWLFAKEYFARAKEIEAKIAHAIGTLAVGAAGFAKDFDVATTSSRKMSELRKSVNFKEQVKVVLSAYGNYPAHLQEEVDRIERLKRMHDSEGTTPKKKRRNA